MKRFVFRFCLTMLVSLLILGAIPVVEVAPSEAATSEYGANANNTGNPIGGGAGYTKIVDPNSADFYVSSRSELLTALTKATSGQIVYVADGAQIDLTGYKNIVVPAGITLASGRGRNGSAGGLIYTSERKTGYGYNKFFKTGSNVRITGIRLRGPDSEIGSSTYTYQVYSGIVSSSSGKIEVDNCEIYNWSEAGVMVQLTREGYVHHNNIHHCRRTGLGYGVAVAGGTALVEANLFDYNRHSIMGTRDYPVSSYEARYNIVGPNATNTMLDVHGGNDTPSWGFADGPDASVPAGGTILIHHNTFKSSTQAAVGIRGVPADICRVCNNWTYWPSSKSTATFIQRLENLGLKPYVRMSVYDNWYGTTSPPTTTSGSAAPVDPTPSVEPAPPTSTSTSNRAPLTPAAPSGTAKGWAGTSYSYSTVSTDPDGDTLRYTFNWGDATTTTTGAYNPGATAYGSHTWPRPGTYWVYVRATDSKGAASSLSRPLVVSISSAGTGPVASAPAIAPSTPPAGPATNAADTEDVPPLAPAQTVDGSASTSLEYWAAPNGPVYWAMPIEIDVSVAVTPSVFNFDGEDGRSTTSALLNSDVDGPVNPWARWRDSSESGAVSEAGTSDAGRSGGLPAWAWVVIVIAVALAVRRAGVFLSGKNT